MTDYIQMLNTSYERMLQDFQKNLSEKFMHFSRLLKTEQEARLKAENELADLKLVTAFEKVSAKAKGGYVFLIDGTASMGAFLGLALDAVDALKKNDKRFVKSPVIIFGGTENIQVPNEELLHAKHRNTAMMGGGSGLNHVVDAATNTGAHHIVVITDGDIFDADKAAHKLDLMMQVSDKLTVNGVLLSSLKNLNANYPLQKSLEKLMLKHGKRVTCDVLGGPFKIEERLATALLGSDVKKSKKKKSPKAKTPKK